MEAVLGEKLFTGYSQGNVCYCYISVTRILGWCDEKWVRQARLGALTSCRHLSLLSHFLLHPDAGASFFLLAIPLGRWLGLGMRFLSFLFVFLFGLVLGGGFTGCAGGLNPGGGLYSRNEARDVFLQSLSNAGVPRETVQRVRNGRVLAFSDVLALVESGISGGKIVAYLRATRAPYNFTNTQVRTLARAGADSTLVNFVGRSRGDFLIDARNAAAQDRLLANTRINQSFWNAPYFQNPNYRGPAPFEFIWPAFW